ncbi:MULTISPECIES: glycosyl hydrolase family 8 [unclassified Methylobacterium]|uniref:glycosyl hydrolase family 8 n=1 Tax=unclassified Methylobacterium TaxID=2615210 RepID=UPI0008EC6BDA|nr:MULTISPECIES: glycosyl hydrolase family 8 [unclassified Methylobacterium]SFD88677.1 endoglucanase [Methylobacterium sp. 13MFTsu3.1M2]
MSRRARTPLAAAFLAAAILPAAAASPQDEPAVPPSTAQPGTQPAQAPRTAIQGLAGKLGNDAAWRAYRARFITDQGRVVDTANGQISHSEGQGYGMLLAVAAGDRVSFERIWGWTRANLMVRGDELLAWRWSPDKRPAVSDMNNATDGDILIAWALTEAAEAWNEPSYRTAARRIAIEFGRKTILFRDSHGALLLPAVSGFSARERPDGPLINLSYWIFPAFPRLALVAPEYDWAALTRSGLALLRQSRFGPSNLPTEWISAKEAPRPANGFPPLFSYNAIRIPLYLVWAGLVRPDDLAPFQALWSGADRERLPIVDTGDGRKVEWLTEAGYMGLPALVACALDGTPFPEDARGDIGNQNYYPATLSLLALTAARMRYPSCLKS